MISNEILGKLGLADRANLLPSQLSGGEQQRVAIARALVKRPSLLFADEPTSSLDWHNGQKVMDLLRQIAREDGTSVLLSTHDQRVREMSDRCLYLNGGVVQSEERR